MKLLFSLMTPLLMVAQPTVSTVDTTGQSINTDRIEVATPGQYDQQPYLPYLDTVYVSDRAKSYLLFDKPVTLADVGNPTLYHVQIEDNSILVVATSDSVAGTPFYAVVGGEPFTARLQFHPNPVAFYDFRSRSYRPDNSHQNQALEGQVLSRLQELASYPDLNYASTREDGIRFQLVGLLHDFTTTYLKFKVENRTSLVYKTDFIGFERLKRYRKGLFSKEQQARFPLEPIAHELVGHVLPYSEHDLYYALPLQALEQNEAIITTLRESSGSRSISLKIPARLFRRADLY